MIPKTIHWIWLSGEEVPIRLQNFMKSWKEILRGYEIKKWEMSAEFLAIPFVKFAVMREQWALASDYLRLYILEKEGGIYFDSDIVVYKPFDRFLNHKFFSAVEHWKKNPSKTEYGIQAAVMGSVSGHPFLKDTMAFYDSLAGGFKESVLDMSTIAPQMYAKVMASYGYQPKDVLQELQSGITLYPDAVFAGHHTRVTERAFCLHVCAGSWRAQAKQIRAKKNYVCFETNDVPLNDDLLDYSSFKFSDLLKKNKKDSATKDEVSENFVPPEPQPEIPLPTERNPAPNRAVEPKPSPTIDTRQEFIGHQNEHPANRLMNHAPAVVAVNHPSDHPAQNVIPHEIPAPVVNLTNKILIGIPYSASLSAETSEAIYAMRDKTADWHVEFESGSDLTCSKLMRKAIDEGYKKLLLLTPSIIVPTNLLSDLLEINEPLTTCWAPTINVDIDAVAFQMMSDNQMPLEIPPSNISCLLLDVDWCINQKYDTTWFGAISEYSDELPTKNFLTQAKKRGGSIVCATWLSYKKIVVKSSSESSRVSESKLIFDGGNAVESIKSDIANLYNIAENLRNAVKAFEVKFAKFTSEPEK